ncbi:hypothetical protein Tco_0291547 [Tanacetum coccineum]
MPSHLHKKFRWGTVFATGRRSFIEPGTGLWMKRINPTEEEVEENEGMKEVWEKIEYVISDSDLDLQSTARNCYFRILDIDLVFYEMDGVMVEIVPYIVTQVTANVNKANRENENGRNNGCSYKNFTAYNPKEFDGKGDAVALGKPGEVDLVCQPSKQHSDETAGVEELYFTLGTMALLRD